jgi:periplasmic divalent cation tolerance protein
MESFVVAVVTVPNEEVGERIARALVEERLAACVNLVPRVRSIYRWRGEVCDEGELLLWVKTRGARFPELQERVRALHPYELPEIIALPISQGFPPYLSWVAQESADPSGY